MIWETMNASTDDQTLSLRPLKRVFYLSCQTPSIMSSIAGVQQPVPRWRKSFERLLEYQCRAAAKAAVNTFNRDRENDNMPREHGWQTKRQRPGMCWGKGRDAISKCLGQEIDNKVYGCHKHCCKKRKITVYLR